MNVIRFTELGSTNDYALNNIVKLNDKDIIIANKQTKGKGRLGRTWISENENNLYSTLVLKPNNIDKHILPNITQYMGVVVCRSLEKYNIIPSIKWPNDILIDGRKIAGILTETAFFGNILQGIAIGIGINCGMTDLELSSIDKPAISLNILVGRSINIDELVKDLWTEFFRDYDDFLRYGFLSIKNEYLSRIKFLGERICVLVKDEIIDCIAKDIDDMGRLIILDKDNQEIKLTLGDVLY